MEIVKFQCLPYDHRPVTALVDTYCTPYSGKIDPCLPLDKYHIHRSDTDFDPRHRIDYTPSKCTG